MYFCHRLSTRWGDFELRLIWVDPFELGLWIVFELVLWVIYESGLWVISEMAFWVVFKKKSSLSWFLESSLCRPFESFWVGSLNQLFDLSPWVIFESTLWVGSLNWLFELAVSVVLIQRSPFEVDSLSNFRAGNFDSSLSVLFESVWVSPLNCFWDVVPWVFLSPFFKSVLWIVLSHVLKLSLS